MARASLALRRARPQAQRVFTDTEERLVCEMLKQRSLEGFPIGKAALSAYVRRAARVSRARHAKRARARSLLWSRRAHMAARPTLVGARVRRSCELTSRLPTAQKKHPGGNPLTGELYKCGLDFVDDFLEGQIPND